MIKPSLRSIFENTCPDLRFRSDCPDLWNIAFGQLPYRPVAYCQSSLDYQLAYQRGHGGTWTDMSCLILWNRKPVALWPLTISDHGGQMRLSSQGLPVLPPLFVRDCPSSRRKAFSNACLRISGEICDAIGIETWASHEPFHASYTLSDWHLLSMTRGARAECRHELYVDLSMSLNDIKGSFRKSFRPLVSAGSRLWRVEIIQAPGDELAWEEFKQLHALVAGRVTRSRESWDLQHRAIQTDEAFLVALRDGSDRMVGGGFFSCTADEGVYAVAAYDRSLFDKPLGHVVQFRAIQELQRRKCRWYKIGFRSYHADQPKPSEKELTIAAFKQGFATHVFPSFLMYHRCLQIEPHSLISCDDHSRSGKSLCNLT